MCAINGISWKDEALVKKMNLRSQHRGKDATGVFSEENVTLGHNRLSIIDLDNRASQPMQKDGYAISFNGEIYNFLEIKKELEDSFEFSTQSDTEVILAGYRKWGKEVFSRLNGIFALAIYDPQKDIIVLARDPVGVKPLYVYEGGGKKLAFASEIKSLLEVGVARSLNKEAFSAYMHTLYVPGEETLFKGIKKFPKSTIGIIKNGNISYELFSFVSEKKSISYKNSSELKREVCAAVHRQMVSDRPLGIYLSGGVDSSAVLACAVQKNKNINTYSIGFDLSDEEESEKFNADALLAKKVSNHFGATHHEFFIKPENVLKLWRKAIFHLDEPIANATIASQIALSEEVSKSVIVTLTGDGGDEVFGGYPRYLLARRVLFLQKFIPKFLLRLLPGRFKHLAAEDLEGLYTLFHFQKKKNLSKVLVGDVRVPKFFKEPVVDLLQADRDTWLLGEALMRSDKLSMANGVESRAPLLDLELFEQVKNFPFEKQVELFETKVLLKKAFVQDLPEWLLKQPKRGWFSPGAKWLRSQSLQEEFKEILSPKFAPNVAGLFNWKEVEKMFYEHKEKKAYHATMLLAIIMFQLWAKEYKVSL